MARRVGIFGGTFDPVHLGHVGLVVSMMELHHLDHLFVIPVYINPLKIAPTSADHRLKMVKIAFKDVPHVTVLPLEIRRKGPSYTIDTIKALYKKKHVQPGDELFLLMGEDVVSSFDRWMKAEELLQLVTPIVGTRSPISATEIRDRLKQGLFCGHLLAKGVYNYIKRHHLYE